MRKKLFTFLLAIVAGIGILQAEVYSGTCGENLAWDLTNDVLTISGTGDMTNYSYASVPWKSNRLSIKTISISSGVTSIGDYAFNGCSGLTSVTIPNSVTSIGRSAFSGCSGLTSVTIPNSVTSIGKYAFGECTGLTSVTIPNSVEIIGDEAFSYCLNLVSLNVENGNQNFSSEDGVLLNKQKTTIIQYPQGRQGAYTIPNSVTSIGNSAFEICTGLTSVTIPNSVTSIGSSAFDGCFSLTSVTIPNSVTSIGSSAFSGVPNIVYSGTATGSPWGALSVNGYVEGWVVYADASKTSLLACFTAAQGEIVIPNSVTSIGEAAFWSCSGLTSMTIPNSVTSIGRYAFAYCRGLTSVTIGNSVTSIGDDAFYNCSGLTSVTNFANTPQEIDSYVFYNVDKSTCVLYVPAGSISAYQSADGWKNFTNILPIGAQSADVTTTTVTPSATTADIAWPQVTGAATYTIEIKKNEELICTLTFNAQGQLQSIAFNAPSRNNAPHQAQAAGFAFTVTSLDSGTTYSYTMTAKGNNGNVLKTESGAFTTTGDVQGIEDVQGNNVQRTKVVRNGQIFILRDGKTYTLQGQLVR